MNNQTERLLELYFEDNSLLAELYGENNINLDRLSQALDITITCKANVLNLIGKNANVQTAREVLDNLWDRLNNNLPVTVTDVDAALRIVTSTADRDTRDKAMRSIKGKPGQHTGSNAAKNRDITPRSTAQATYIDSIEKNEIVFGIGPAGTGKTYLAVAIGINMLLTGKVDRLVITRPAVEAGEHLGFLPGDMKDKIDPYLRPIYDALNDLLNPDQVLRLLAQGTIEIAPLAFMRGRTLANAFVILDEAQNSTTMQMKMFLTRLGENGRMVVNGDISQTDLPNGQTSGLAQAVDLLRPIDDIKICRFTAKDVVRHPLVAKIIDAYDKKNEQASN